MKTKLIVLITIISLGLFSCNNDEYDEYIIATPLTMKMSEFKEASVAVIAPEPITQSGKIYAYGDYIFVNDQFRGFHVLDNTDATEPKQIAFIKLEGNYDISIRDNRLYADSYGDLVVMDISDITNIKLTNRVEDAIYEDYGYTMPLYVEWPQADFYDYENIDWDDDAIIGWEVRTERKLVSEYEARFNNNSSDIASLSNAESASPSGGTTGEGGSMARFKIVGDYLYVVDFNSINIMDISDLDNPVPQEKVWGQGTIETIYNQGDILFLGGTQGMYIYDITAPGTPTLVSEFRHGTACDPVVVDRNYAYVTLRGGNTCGSTESGLYVVNIEDLKNPILDAIYPLESPYGLGIKNDMLFVCDGAAGLKVFDKSLSPALVQVNHFKDVNPYDVIPLSNSLLMIGDNTLNQYEYNDDTINLLSSFNLGN